MADTIINGDTTTAKSVHLLISQWEQKVASSSVPQSSTSPPLSYRKSKLNDPLSNSALTAETSSSLQAIAADGKRSLESINASRESGLQSSIPVLYRSASSCNNELLLQIDSTISNSQSSLVKSLASQFSCLSTTYNSSTAAAAVSSKFTPSFPTFVSQKQHISLPPNTASTNTNTTSTASKPPAFKRFTQIPQPSLSLPPSLVMISNNTINSTDMFRRPSLILSQLPFSPVRDLLASNEAKAMDRRLVNTTNKVTAQRMQRLCDRALQTIFEKPAVDVQTCRDLRRMSRTIHRLKDSSGDSLNGSCSSESEDEANIK